jgi:hypothetical protein
VIKSAKGTWRLRNNSAQSWWLGMVASHDAESVQNFSIAHSSDLDRTIHEYNAIKFSIKR